MDPLKSRDRRKLLTCFKPVTLDYSPRYNAALPNSFEFQRTKNHPCFSAALKSVLVKSFLGRKLQRKKPLKDSSRSSSDLSSESSEKLNNTIKKISSHSKSLDSGEFITRSTNSSASTSTRSSITSSPDMIKGPFVVDSTNTDKPTFTRDGDRRAFSPTTIGMFIFIVGLFALVFGGKPFAILISTSMCLTVAPRRRSQRREPVDNQVIESDEYKKRVIMEGMLERNRPRAICP